MKILIIPIEKNYNSINEEIIEFESNSPSEIFKKTDSIENGKSYSIEVYKKHNDFLFFELDVTKSKVYYLIAEEQIQIVIRETPHKKVIELVNIYINKLGSQNIEKYFLTYLNEEKKREKEKYENWRRIYPSKRKKEQKRRIQNILVSILITLIIFYIANLFWTDEARFFAKKTMVKNGIVVNTKFKQRGNAGVYQRVDYEFKHEGKNYKTYFWANRITGQKHIGDSIMIKFEVNNPSNSKYFSK